MEENKKRKELYNLSSQFMDVFVGDLLAKNKVNLTAVKERMTTEQREGLKNTVENLKAEVEKFLESGQRKTVTEEDQVTEKKESPLREKLYKKKENKDDQNDK